MIVWSPMRRVDPAHIALVSGVTRPWIDIQSRMAIPAIARPQSGLSGLGQVSLPTIWDAGSIPWDDPTGVSGAATTGTGSILGGLPIIGDVVHFIEGIVSAVESWLGIGAGRREADIIVPIQNQLTASWGPCVDAIRTGHPCNIDFFNQCYIKTWQGGVAFMQFIQRRDLFSDGRASEQAANGIMPYIDGSCGYKWPPPMTPTQFNTCLGVGQTIPGWGGGTIGGTGTDGILGAIARTIKACGGSGPPQIGPGGTIIGGTPGTIPGTTMGISTNVLLVGLGIAALALYGRRSRG